MTESVADSLTMNEHVEVAWLILADAAQIAGGKLYMLGGGWDTVNVVRGFPARHNLGIAAAFSVPWTRTNEKHLFELEITDIDKREGAMFESSGGFEAGRPAGFPPGKAQLVQIAGQGIVDFKNPGEYQVIARIVGGHEKTFQFRVVAAGAQNVPRQARG